MMKVSQWIAMETEWSQIRANWSKRSLFLNTTVSVGQSVRISNHLRVHSISRGRRALDGLKIEDRMRINQALENIGQITGRIETEEILGRVFSRFCIGK